MRQQAKESTSVRTPFGATVAGSDRPWVTQSIIVLCVLVYVSQKLPGSKVTTNFEFAPPYATSQPWRLLTAVFLHAPDQPLHILFNMYALWLTGPYLEQLFGRLRFALLFLISGLGGSIGYLLLASPGSDGWYTGTIGASGAVFGLFGAYFVVQRKLKRDTAPLLAIILINFAFGFIVSGIAWQAHVGGLITGVLTAGALAYAPRTNRPKFQFAGLAAVAVLLVLLFVVKVATVPAGLLA